MRMKLRSTLTVVGVACAGAIGTTGTWHAGAAGPGGFTCGGSLASPEPIPGGTYSSLTMPAGSLCAVAGDVRVTSPVTVGTGAGLVVFGGSLRVDGAVAVGAQGVLASLSNDTPVTIAGAVGVGQNAAFIVGTETPGGPLVNSIGGPVTGAGASSVQIHNTAVGGPIRLTGGGGDNAIVDFFSGGFPGNFNDLEDDVIGGPVVVTGYQGVWMGIIRDVIHGPMTFTGNTESNIDEYDIGSDTIDGPATCSDNTPAPNIGESPGAPSTVSGPIRGNQAATCTSAA
ncbi:MAG TPA: hypothetical protein VFO60_09855 [Candidatus Dormibacteraeota bacterium]|nr:hypothetical protein [Candidatus Dormibacteraeota bacterium]